MARRNTALKVVPPALSPERQALAEAIAEYRAYADEIKTLDRAVDRANTAWMAAKQRKDRATDALDETKGQAAERAIEAVLNDTPRKGSATRAARIELVDAEDEMEEAALAVETLKERLQSAHASFYGPGMRLHEAIIAVMRGAPQVAALLGKVSDLQRQLADAGAALLFLDDKKVLGDRSLSAPHSGPISTDGIPPAVVCAIDRLMSPPRTWGGLLREVPGDGPWQDAYQALGADAAAALPDV